MALAACKPPAPPVENAVAIDANQTTAGLDSAAAPAPAASDELADSAEVISIQDGTYPMYGLTLKLFSEPRATITLDANAEALGLGADGIKALKGLTVAVRYTVRPEPDLRDLHFRGASLFGPDAPKPGPGLTRIEGVLSGAQAESGDLPSKITITPAAGPPVSFDFYVTAAHIAANGQTVVGDYGMKPANRIISISPAS